jgi:hypothetical protein
MAADLLHRGRRACFQWIDRWAAPWKLAAPWNPFRQFTRGAILQDMQQFLSREDYWGAAATLRQHFSAEVPARFFVGLFDDTVPARFSERLSHAREQIIRQADALCEGRFNILGYEDLTFGDPVDWHLDPVARRRAPLLHWSRINPSDVAVCGDSRIVWQLNRHQWLVSLGEAFRLTGDSRYAERFDAAIRDWIRVNPTGMGLNWANSQEVAYRLIAWSWALALFWPAAVLTPDLLTLILDQMRLHAVHIDRYLSFGPPPNGPLMVEALALFYMGSLFPELRQAPRWRKKGQALLDRQIMAEVSPDGLCRTPSTVHLHRIIEASLHFLILAERNGQPVRQEIRDRLRALLDAVLPLRRPDGMMMQIGEGDSDWVVPLVQRTKDDWRGLFALAAVLFEDAHYAWAADGESVEVLWLLGPAGEETLNNLVPLPPAAGTSGAPGARGYVQMRSGWERRSHQLVLDIGSSGTRGSGAGDLLSIQCSAFGEPIIIDPDLSGPAGHPEWQDFVRKTSMHSTLLVDGIRPSLSRSDWWPRRGQRPKSVLRQWNRNDRFELVDAAHDGYRGLADPVVHRRRVLFVKRAYWILIDDVQGAGRHRIDLVFQIPGLRTELEPSLGAKVWTANGPGLAIKPFAGIPLHGEILEGLGEAGGRGVSQGQQVRTLCYRCDAEAPVRLVTLLFPLPDARALVPGVTPLFDDQRRLSGLTIDDPASAILYSDHSVTVEAA